ncbi:response regulator transcription factor [Marilutibacter alkalisoli]|nr:response regulator transcription factor [Lysobacter alkalisoli]
MSSSTPKTSIRPTLAVVEDDAELREQILLPALARAGFEVAGMASALELYRAMAGTSYDLVVLDVGLPDDDGLSIARHLRSLSPTIGIVILTGYGSGKDRLRGLQAGVDAYLSKPADMDELAMTLHNLAKRVQPGQGQADAGPGRWRLDEGGWRLRSPGGGEVTLNLFEREVIKMLAAASGMPVRRDALIAQLVEDIHDFDPHRLEMLVYRLRKKCLKLTEEELPLRAVRGIGYVLAW